MALLLVLLTPLAAQAAPTLPDGFNDEVAFTGLSNPVNVEFADGKVYVAEKGGEIKVFDSLTDTTPDALGTGLEPEVHNFWDRGMLGMAVDPQFPARPYIYVLYTYDHILGDPNPAPKWGDDCPTPPGATDQGCVVSGRLTRLTVDATGKATVPGSARVLIEDWCQQFPSQSTGDLAFGPDGALYASGGDGASFNYADYGQTGNPCNDPLGDGGSADNEGGALRSQDTRTAGDPVTLDGTVVRIDAATLADLPAGTPALTDNASRIVASGLRNPFRFTVRPGSDEVWLGDVGWGAWEEVDRIQPGGPAENFGWPCYEGNAVQFIGFNICANLGAGEVTGPVYAYRHNADMTLNTGPDGVPAGRCHGVGSAVAGLAFGDPAGNYPARYDDALFFADHSRGCIAAMRKGGDGLPDPATTELFAAAATGIVDLKLGPDRNLYWVELLGGVHRISFTSGNQQPTAVIGANPTSGPAPLAVSFDGTGSSDPDAGDTFTYSWDLDGDGTFGDSTSPTPTFTYAAVGTYTAKLQVTDNHGLASDPATVTVSAGNSAPVATIDGPAATLRWKAGDLVDFSGHATDPQEGDLPATKLSWSLALHHCDAPDDCHVDTIQDFPEAASGSFSAPDHSYPAWLELTLTATDSGGLTDTESVRLDPQTVALTFASSPTGLQLKVGPTSSTTEFTRTVIVGSQNSIQAPTPQTLDGAVYNFASWSDGGAAQHDITAPATPATYTATYRANQQPTAVIGANPTSGPAPLAVSFDGTGSSDPDTGDTFTYSWDLDGDGTFGDSTEPFPTFTYAAVGTYTAKLQVTDNHGLASDPATVTVSAGNSAPVATIDGPAATFKWQVGDLVDFSGHATDPQEGDLPATELSWSAALHHCDAPDDCHIHPIEEFTGVAGGSFTAPDHEPGSWIELTLTATDSGGLTGTKSVRLDPQTVALTFASSPTGLQLTVGGTESTTEFTRTVIVGSQNGIQAPTPQTLDGAVYNFASWSDGGDAQHDITAPATPATYTATYTAAPAGCPSGQWQAAYYANQTLTGPATTERCEAGIDYDWGTGSPPGSGVGPDNFSVRWVRSQTFAAGDYTFTATADDGVRVYLDNTLLIDHWNDQAPTTFTVTRAVTAGDHQLTVEHYENGGGAVARFSVAEAVPPPTSCPNGQYLASYYANKTGTPPAATVRCETDINNEWAAGGPAGAGVGPDNFSARWVGTKTFAAGTYTFTATGDDGIRVWVDGTLLIDQWKLQSATSYSATRTLTAGDHEIKMEYYENQGYAVAKLHVAASSPPPTSCPVGHYLASYYPNKTLTSPPTTARCEGAINNNWGLGSPPGTGVGPDRFSVRWVGTRSFAAGNFTFTVTADDGARVYVDGVLVINQWKDQPATTYKVTRNMTAGNHQVRMEYYENGGAALARLTVSP